MKTKEDPLHLYHFTEFKYLFLILLTKKLTFTDPENWDDKNDRCSIQRYQDINRIKNLLTLCFTTERESYYFWKIYGANGVRIEFNKQGLEEKLTAQGIPPLKPVEYRTIKHLEERYLSNTDTSIKTKLPFLKRCVYRGEKEWRATYESNEVEKTKEILIGNDLNIIKEIALNPWLSKDEFEGIKKVIKKILPVVNIVPSGVIEHPEWTKTMNEIARKYNNL